MIRNIVQTKIFEEEIARLIKKRKLKKEDFEDFKKSLAENPSKAM